ncbi:hypothetical protein G9P44_000201 [Scheffersomyces stipitis]|nr:hypothetical protein G9P44_000201 [Scheffersomyces stipitis]
MTSSTATTTINPSVTDVNHASPQSIHNGNMTHATGEDGAITTANGTSAVAQAPSKASRHNKRSELEALIHEFQSKLGNDWEKYHETLSLFLIGKLSRAELVAIIKPILKDNLIRYHNKLLLLNFANSLKDGPLDYSNEFSSFWNKKAQKSSKVKSSQYEKFKQNIMGLPIKERRRIKNITRDSGKKGKLSAGITLARHSLLPKIPMIQDKEQQQLQVNNLVQWQQDVVNGINTPIATQNYELPEYDNLSRRILMTMREHGLTGGLNASVLEMILLGLESHLKNIIDSAIDVAKYRQNKYTNNDYIPLEANKSHDIGISNKKRSFEDMKVDSSKDITLNIEDLYSTFEMFPHLIEPCGPRYRLANVMLENDDMAGKELDYDLPPRLGVFPVANGTSSTIANTKTAEQIKVENTVKSNPASDKLHENADKITMNGSLKSESETEKKSSDSKTVSAVPHAQVPGPDSHIGTTDELKWVLHDLISTM